MTADNPKTVRELLSKPGVWIKGALARNAQGAPVGVNNPDACHFCLLGAVWKVYGETSIKSLQVRNNIEAFLGFKYASFWNDHEERTLEQVLALCKELDI